MQHAPSKHGLHADGYDAMQSKIQQAYLADTAAGTCSPISLTSPWGQWQYLTCSLGAAKVAQQTLHDLMLTHGKAPSTTWADLGEHDQALIRYAGMRLAPEATIEGMLSVVDQMVDRREVYNRDATLIFARLNGILEDLTNALDSEALPDLSAVASDLWLLGGQYPQHPDLDEVATLLSEIADEWVDFLTDEDDDDEDEDE